MKDREPFIREEHETREDWLKAKYETKESSYRISATEAPAILGYSPWMTSADLYDQKLGIKPRQDISDKRYVQYGIAMEPMIRDAAMVDLPYFKLGYHAYDILVSRYYPWMSCTLDGELEITDSYNPWGFHEGAKGILECKTGSFRNEHDLEEWERRIPEHYYIQMLHAMIVTGADFGICAARIKRDAFKDDDQGFPEIRNFYHIIDRRTYGLDNMIHGMIEAEKSFIENNLKQGKRPDVIVRI